jgi:ABC-2 type transport system ATP-binding protein
MISVKKLEKRYGSLQAIKNVSFEVEKGEIVGLLGHNAAGKTTIMKIITGFLEASGGTVTVGGVDVSQDRLGVQKQIGYMPENAPLYEEMLVQEYLMMMAELREIPDDRRLQAVAEAIKATGLGEVLVQPIATLSKGFRQRVALCQAILHKPDVLILDEPTNGLDPVQIMEIRRLIRKLASNSTVFLSTHILPEIEAVCDRVLILIDGLLAKDARLDELLKSDRIRLSVSESAAEVETRLRALPGVASVSRLGPDPARQGFVLWRIETGNGEQPTPAVVKTAAEAGWEVAQVTADTPTLEQVFSELMDEHVKRTVSSSKQEVAS